MSINTSTLYPRGRKLTNFEADWDHNRRRTLSARQSHQKRVQLRKFRAALVRTYTMLRTTTLSRWLRPCRITSCWPFSPHSFFYPRSSPSFRSPGFSTRTRPNGPICSSGRHEHRSQSSVRRDNAQPRTFPVPRFLRYVVDRLGWSGSRARTAQYRLRRRRHPSVLENQAPRHFSRAGDRVAAASGAGHHDFGPTFRPVAVLSPAFVEGVVVDLAIHSLDDLHRLHCSRG